MACCAPPHERVCCVGDRSTMHHIASLLRLASPPVDTTLATAEAFQTRSKEVVPASAEQQVQQFHRSALVQRLVLVAALGGLDA